MSSTRRLRDAIDTVQDKQLTPESTSAITASLLEIIEMSGKMPADTTNLSVLRSLSKELFSSVYLHDSSNAHRLCESIAHWYALRMAELMINEGL